jgi:hypothetical protein
MVVGEVIVRDQGPGKLALLSELGVATAPAATTTAAPESEAARSDVHDSTEAGDQTVAGNDAALADGPGGGGRRK